VRDNWVTKKPEVSPAFLLGRIIVGQFLPVVILRLLLLLSRMGFLVDFFESSGGKMGVNLCSG